jgi:hypothetical protein
LRRLSPRCPSPLHQLTMSARGPLRPRRFARIDAAVLNRFAAQRVILTTSRRRRHIAAHGHRIGRTTHRCRWISGRAGRCRDHAGCRRHGAGRLTGIRICRRSRNRGLTGAARGRWGRGYSRFTLHVGLRGLACAIRHALSDRNASSASAKGQHGGTCKHDRFHRDILSVLHPVLPFGG